MFSAATCVQLDNNQLASVDGLEKLVNLTNLCVSACVCDTAVPTFVFVLNRDVCTVERQPADIC